MAKQRVRLPMPAAVRAKQFMPFAAVKGLTEALEKKEKIRVPRRCLSEEMEQELNLALLELKRGQIATVVYYDAAEEEYVQLTGMVAKIDEFARVLQLVKTRIAFIDLFAIENVTA